MGSRHATTFPSRACQPDNSSSAAFAEVGPRTAKQLTQAFATLAVMGPQGHVHDAAAGDRVACGCCPLLADGVAPQLASLLNWAELAAGVFYELVA
jgi:hypothetical protein